MPSARACRMWSGFSSEIETLDITTRMQSSWGRMWSGFSSEIETLSLWVYCHSLVCRMWSGFSSEIETHHGCLHDIALGSVACGAASRLRLKRKCARGSHAPPDVACGAASRLRLKRGYAREKQQRACTSHVERLLV